MGVLSDSLQKRALELQAQRDRIVGNQARELAEIDGQIAALETAGKSLTKDVEDTYERLLSMGLIQPVSR
jgi:hypothetical protein